MADRPECRRCGIEFPVIVSVHHEPLCPNCLHLKNHYPDQFHRDPLYGPVYPGAGDGWPNPIHLF